MTDGAKTLVTIVMLLSMAGVLGVFAGGIFGWIITGKNPLADEPPPPAKRRATVTPALIERFADYNWGHPNWGHLHVVMDDGNFEDHHVEWCVRNDPLDGDPEGVELARILTEFTMGQRARISRLAEEEVDRRMRDLIGQRTPEERR